MVVEISIESSPPPTRAPRDGLILAIGCLIALAILAGCDKRAVAPSSGPDIVNSPAAWFEDTTESSHLHFTHDCGSHGGYFMPQIMGSGCALLDYDNDGLLDIYLVQNGGPNGKRNQLFHQEPDGSFKDVSAGSGLDVAGYGMGVAIGDVNNDGYPDVLITEYGRVRLFLNNGNGTFTDVSKEAGIDSPLWATSAAFVDYDRDGWLDLVVVNYVDYDPSRPCGNAGGESDYCPPGQFVGTVTKLFHNLGGFRIQGSGFSEEAGAASQPSLSSLNPKPRSLNPHPVHFEDVTLKSGLGRVPGPGLGVVCADFDGDGWPDIFVANDEKPNRLWINQHDGTFVDEAAIRGVAYDVLGQARANMGVAIGDLGGNGMFDLLVTHLTDETNTLWKQGPAGVFLDRTAAAGLASPRWRGTGFGVVLEDFDNDGSLDLAVVNGRIARAPAAIRSASESFFDRYVERNQIFGNDGQGHFEDLSEKNAPFCGSQAISRGLAWGDLHNDGRVSLLVTSVNGLAHLFSSVMPDRGHWLGVRATLPHSGGRDAYGAEVTVTAAGKAYKRWLNPATSYLCSNDPRAHFGLGSATSFEQIEVAWPDGTREKFPGGASDRMITVSDGNGTAATRPR